MTSHFRALKSRADALVGVIVAITLIGFVFAMIVASTSSSSSSLSSTESRAYADTYGQNVIKSLRATPWDRIGFSNDQLSGLTGYVKLDGSAPTNTVILASGDGLYDPIQEGTEINGIKGAKFTVKTFIEWVNFVPTPETTGNYGSKRITVEILWVDKNGTESRMAEVKEILHPTTSEAVPSGINVGDGLTVIHNVANPTISAQVSENDISIVGSVFMSSGYTIERIASTSATAPTDWSSATAFQTASFGSVSASRGYSHPFSEGAVSWLRIVSRSPQAGAETLHSSAIRVDATSYFNAPTGLTTSTNAQQTYVDLSWSANPPSIYHFPADEGTWRVEHSTNNSSWATVAPSIAKGTRTFRHSAPTYGATNYYRVCAVLYGTSKCSSSVNRYIVADTDAPTLTSHTFSATNGQSTVGWTTNGKDVGSFVVSHRTDSGSWTNVSGVSSGATSASFTPNPGYVCARVAAVNARGTSPWSNERCVQSSIGNATVVVKSTSTSGVTFTVTGPSGTQRVQYQSKVNGGSWSSISTVNATNGAANITISSGDQGDRIYLQAKAQIGSMTSPSWAGANDYRDIQDISDERYVEVYKDDRPYFTFRMRQAVCPVGTSLQTQAMLWNQGTDRPTSYGSWSINSGIRYTSVEYQITNSLFTRKSAANINGRCRNDETGRVGGSGTAGLWSDLRAMPTPRAVNINADGSCGFRTACWVATCDDGTSERYSRSISANWGSVSYNSYSTTTEYSNSAIWGYWEVTVRMRCFVDETGRWDSGTTRNGSVVTWEAVSNSNGAGRASLKKIG